MRLGRALAVGWMGAACSRGGKALYITAAVTMKDKDISRSALIRCFRM